MKKLLNVQFFILSPDLKTSFTSPPPPYLLKGWVLFFKKSIYVRSSVDRQELLKQTLSMGYLKKFCLLNEFHYLIIPLLKPR